MTNLREYENRLRDAFSDSLLMRGFSARGSEVEFVREKAGVEQSIVFVGRWEYGTDSFRFHFAVSDRYVDLERLVCPDDKSGVIPIVASPIHLLREDASLYEWYLDRPETVTLVLNQIDKYGLPFLDRYTSLTAVKERLISSSPGDWFLLNSEGRIRLLASILFFEGDGAQSLRIVDNAIEERASSLPKHRWRLERLRAHLIEQQRPSD
jgi:hypothetical protein